MSSKSLDFALAFGSREDVASATTTDIGSTSSRYVRITGTTTITSLGTADAGTIREVLFGSSLTLTHNGTSLILPGGENIETSPGDIIEFVSEGSGKWRCVRYILGNIAPVYIERGSAKAWANLNGTGTIALRDSLNVSSVVDNGTGSYTFNATNNFANTAYSAISGVGQPTASGGLAQSHGNNSVGNVDPTVSAWLVLIQRVELGSIDAAYVLTDVKGDLA